LITDVNAYAYRIYAARGAPFRIEGVRLVLYLYILWRRRLLSHCTLDTTGYPRTSIYKSV